MASSGMLRVLAAVTVLLAVASAEGLFEGHGVLSCPVGTTREATTLVDEIHKLGGDMWTHHISPGASVHVQLPGEHLEGFRGRFGCETMIADLQQRVDEHLRRDVWLQEASDSKEGWYSKYHRFDDQVAKLKAISKEHPHLVRFVPSMGKKTHEGREIPVMHISSQGSKTQKQQILLLGGQHAREWDASANVVYFAQKLAESHKSDPVVRKLLNDFEFVVAPNLNPDGYEHSHTTNRLWRKNRRNNGDGTFGVDLNRNWPNHWGEGHGASTRTSATDYQGPSSASEPEVQAVASYVKTLKNPIAGIDFHTYGELVLRSKGWTQKLSRDEKLLKALGSKLVKAADQNGGNYKSETAAGLYPTTGSADDWMSEDLGEGKMWAHGWTIELAPTAHNGAGFLLPAKSVLPTAEAMFKGVKEFCLELVKQGKIRKRMGDRQFTQTWAQRGMVESLDSSTSLDLVTLDSES